MKVQWVLLLLILNGLSACSTFSSINPFSHRESENYNALTYGDDYRYSGNAYNGNPNYRASAGGVSRFGEDDRYQYGGGSSGTDSNSRKVASVKNGSSFYEDALDDAQDPTEEQVRQRISVGRGQAVSAYKRGDRATRSDFYDEAPNDGSLWANDQDANYFFSKDKVRSMGDIVSVKLDEPMIRQVAEEIKKSLTPAEQEVEMALYLKNNNLAKEDKDIEAYRNVVSDDLRTSDAADVKDRMEKAVRWSQVDLSKNIGLAANEEMRAEIVDRFQNGNYKIRAMKRVLYRGSSKLVSLNAVAPAVDFDDKDGISSAKLYEYKIKVAR